VLDFACLFHAWSSIFNCAHAWCAVIGCDGLPTRSRPLPRYSVIAMGRPASPHLPLYALPSDHVELAPLEHLEAFDFPTSHGSSPLTRDLSSHQFVRVASRLCNSRRRRWDEMAEKPIPLGCRACIIASRSSLSRACYRSPCPYMRSEGRIGVSERRTRSSAEPWIDRDVPPKQSWSQAAQSIKSPAASHAYHDREGILDRPPAQNKITVRKRKV
jgi:hypothetical protein